MFYYSFLELILLKQVQFSYESPENTSYTLHFHENRQSVYNHEPNMRERIWINAGDSLGIIFGQTTKTKRIAKSNFDCQEDNTNSFPDCLNIYYSKKLKCSLPWANEKRQNYLDCTGKKKFKEFKNLSKSILDLESKKEIKNERCFVPNCEKRSWEIKSTDRYDSLNNNSNDISFEIFHKSKLLVRREVKLYTFLNFFAEVGGYLGLFLGESLVSYLLTGWNWLKIFKRKCTNRQPEEEETVAQ